MLAALLLSPALAAAEDAFAWTYRYLAVNARSDEEMLVALGGIARTPAAKSRENYDVLAQLLVDLAARHEKWKTSPPNIAKLLANGTEAARYHSVLDATRRYAAAPGSADVYTRRLRELGREQAAQYVAGTLDIAALREQYLRAALAATPTMTQAEALAALPTNATLDDFFAAAGPPAHVAPHGVKISDVITVEVRQLWFYYRGIGRVSFDFQRETGWHYYNFIAEPMTFEGWMPYRVRAQEFNQPDDRTLAMLQLLSGNPSAIKVSAQAMHRAEETPVEYMDTAAELLLRDYAALTPAQIDAYAWLCNVLAERGGRRYARVLATVKKNTKDEKLARYAGQEIAAFRGPDGIYAAGAISLDAQKAKYPPLYPQITLVRGLL